MPNGIKMQGARLDQVFRSLQRSIAKDALAEGVTEGGKIVRDDAQRRAPRLTGNLAVNIDVQLTESKPTKARAVVATTDEGYYGTFVEYGHDIVVNKEVVGHVPGKPFMRPAMDENQGRVEEAIGKSIQQAIDEAVRRA